MSFPSNYRAGLHIDQKALIRKTHARAFVDSNLYKCAFISVFAAYCVHSPSMHMHVCDVWFLLFMPVPA